MPIHPDWQELYRSFVEQYGEEKGEEVFYAYCKKHGIDYTKPRPRKESFSWVGDLKPEGNIVRGKALHPLKTVHPEEWPSVRVYLEEELKKSAETLAGKPLLLDHLHTLNGRVLDARYEDGAIEYTASLEEPAILNKIRDGQIKHCSVEFEWDSLKNVNGVAPLGINFVGLSLLSPGVQPGDSGASVELWEGLLKRLREAKAGEQASAEPQEFIYYPVRDPAAFLEDRFSTVWIDRFNGVQGIYGRLRDAPENPRPMALLFMRANNWDMDRVKLWVQEHPQYVKTEPSAVGVQASPTPSSQTGLVGEAEGPALPNPKGSETEKVKMDKVESEKKDEGHKLTIEQLQQQVQELSQGRNELCVQADALWGQIEALQNALKAKIQAQLAAGTLPEAEKQIEALQEQLSLVAGQKKTLEGALRESEAKIKALEEKLSRKPVGEAVISPIDASTIPVDLIDRKWVVQKLEAITPSDFVIRAHGAGGFLKLTQDLKRVKREIEEAKAL